MVEHWLDFAQDDWLGTVDPDAVVRAVLADDVSYPNRGFPVPTDLPEKHARLVKALQALNWRQRQWLQAFVEGGCTKRGAKKILQDRLIDPPGDVTTARWQHRLDYNTALTLLKAHRAEQAGLDRDAIIIRTGEVLEDALTPKPILYMGEPTGYEEINGNVAMRAIEFAGKVNRMVDSDTGGNRVTLVVNIANRDDLEVVAEPVAVQ